MRWKLAVPTVALAFVFAAPAWANDWPTKPVRIVSPFAPGGSSDTVARIMAEQLSTQFGRQFVVENRGGAGGLIGTAAVAKTAPDGYTFVVSSITTHVLGPLTAANVEYDPIRDFAHVAMFGGPPTVIVVHPSLGVNTFKELIALLKSSNAALPYSSAGPRTIGNLMMEFLAEQEKVKLSHVAYKGSGQAMTDLTAGHVKLASFTSTAARGQINSRQLIPLAVSSAKRMPEFPDVPTLAELGYPSLVSTAWLGLAAPANTASAVVDRLNQGIGEALDNERVSKRLIDEGFEIRKMRPTEIVEFIRAEAAKWGPLARKVAPPER